MLPNTLIVCPVDCGKRCNLAFNVPSFKVILQILCHRIIDSPFVRDKNIHHIQFPTFHKRTPTETFPSNDPSTFATQTLVVIKNSVPPETVYSAFEILIIINYSWELLMPCFQLAICHQLTPLIQDISFYLFIFLPISAKYYVCIYKCIQSNTELASIVLPKLGRLIRS